ncbi:YtxH domain-containing protein [Paenibacillus oenotherae]|uniref:YtxH domain-containing protein n=1 Tax=Paenibacillus oenotherae TaxID=1435645 RepID=A0ABS7D8P1_9BACL|nr:YtxH domain-containing protein [Paenibacillus oenotherae]MBW7476154.1 YtxH domain-containing protein [Paenibacillus oenotherae]
MARNRQKDFLFGVLAGGIVGSITALMLAPKSGREIRSDISQGAQQVSGHTVRIAGQVGGTTTRIAKQVGSGATSLATKVKDSADSMIGSVRSWRSSKNEWDTEAVAEETAAVNESPIEAKREAELQSSRS